MIFTFNIHVDIQSSAFRNFKNKSHFGATLDSVIETLFIMCINLKIVKNSLKIQLLEDILKIIDLTRYSQ